MIRPLRYLRILLLLQLLFIHIRQQLILLGKLLFQLLHQVQSVILRFFRPFSCLLRSLRPGPLGIRSQLRFPGVKLRLLLLLFRKPFRICRPHLCLFKILFHLLPRFHRIGPACLCLLKLLPGVLQILDSLPELPCGHILHIIFLHKCFPLPRRQCQQLQRLGGPQIHKRL